MSMIDGVRGMWSGYVALQTVQEENAALKQELQTMQIRLQQDGGNREGLGAWIGVERAKQPTLWRRVRTDGSYLSAGDVRAHFGLGSSASASGVIVRWPDGTRERWARLDADRVTTLRRGTGKTEPENANR